MSALAEFLRWLMDQVGYAICHQMPARTLSYGGDHLPVCARDTGLFMGFAFTFLLLLLLYRRRVGRHHSWKIVVALVAMLLPFLIDALTSYTGLRETTNGVRLVTGSLAGTALAALIFPLFSRLLLGGDEGVPLFERGWSFAIVLLVPAGISLALWPDWAGGFWLWAPLLTISIMLTLLVLNATLIGLLVEWVTEAKANRYTLVVVSLAALASITELIVSNRLHWLVNKFL